MQMYCTETSQHAPLNSTASAYLRATANSLDKVKRSLLLLGNMAAKMSVNKPDEGNVTENVVIKLKMKTDNTVN